MVYAAEAYIVAVMSIGFAWIAQPNNDFHWLIMNEEPLGIYFPLGSIVAETRPH